MARPRIALASLLLLATLVLAGCIGAEDTPPAEAADEEDPGPEDTTDETGEVENVTEDLPVVERIVVAEDVIPHQPPRNYTYNVEGRDDTTIEVPVNSTVKLTMVSHEQNLFPHDIRSDSLGFDTDNIDAGEELTVTFNVTEPGPNVYWCDVGDHRDRGMEGVILVNPR